MKKCIVAVAAGALFLAAGCKGGKKDDPPPRHAISGTITRAWGGPLAGVTVTLGGGGTAVSGTDGTFTFTGLADGSYTLTPALAGYAFTPSAPTVVLTGASQVQDFSADGARTISGRVVATWGAPLEDAVVSLSGGGVTKPPALTDVTGSYSFKVPDGTFTVAAERGGYVLTPSAPSVVVSGADETQDFDAEGAYTISGTVATAWDAVLPGASVSLSGGGVTKPAVLTDASGRYAFAVPDGTFTLAPLLPGYVFSPAEPSVVVSGASRTQDFSADGAYTLSGTVATAWGTLLPGTSVSLSGGGVAKPPVLTGADGRYAFAVPDGTFTLAASRAGYAFSPSEPSVIVSGGSRTQDFSADGARTLSGTITTAWGTALAGASVSLSGGGVTKAAATDAGGSFTFNVPDGTFTVAPGLAGWVFDPPDPDVVVSGASATRDFSADGAYTISGIIAGSVQAGVTVALSGGGVVKAAAVSANGGAYAFSGIPNGTYTLTPTLAGHAFTPPDPAVVVSGASATQDFTSYVPTYAIRGTVSGGYGAAGTAGMTVRLSGASTAIATTDAAGAYAFEGLTAGGTYTVTVATFGFWSFPESQTFEVWSDVTDANFGAYAAGPMANTYEGTLSYSGSKTGPVYVSVEWSDSGGAAGGTGLPAAEGPWSGRAFSIRNAQIGGDVTVRAWIDTLGIGRFNAGADPSATFTGNTYVPGSVDVVDVGELTLVDPSGDPTVSSPLALNAIVPGDGVAAVAYEAPRDESGSELADSYRVYWNDSATVDPAHALGMVTVRAGTDFALVHGLSNATGYWFRVEAWLGGGPLIGQSVVTTSAVVPAAPTGNAAVSGTVSHPAVPSPSALYVVAQAGKGPDGAYLLRIPDPAGTQTAYSMSVPEGVYQLFAFVDVGDDGGVTAGEPAGFPDQKMPLTSLVPGPNGHDISVPGGSGSASLVTSRWAMQYSAWTSLSLGVASGLKVPLAAAVTGPGLRGPVDLGMSRDGGSSVSLNAQFGTDPILPFVGDVYTMDVTYTDGSTERFERTITGLFGSPPAIVAPADADHEVSVVPTFLWDPPAGAPGAYGYEIQVRPYDGDSVWETFLPGTVTSVVYDADGTARSPQLSPLTAYRWLIRAIDPDGNEASRVAGFTTGAPPLELELYDPLTATTLDGMRWQTPQLTRSISGGKALLWVEGDGMQGRLEQNQTYTNAITVLAGASRVTSFQADVSVPSASAARTGTATIMGGVRLHYQPAPRRGFPFPDQNLDLLVAALELYDDGGGLQLRRRFFHCDDAPCITTSAAGIGVVDPPEFVVGGADASVAASFGATYTLSVSLDESTGVFTWSVQGGNLASPVSGTADASAWASSVGMTLGSTTNGFAAARLFTRAVDDSLQGGSSGSMAAEFDNVMVGLNGAPATLWDDFETMGSSTTFSPARWGAADNDVFLSGGSLHLRSEVTTAATGPRATSTAANVMYPVLFRAWQARVAIVADEPAPVSGSGNSFGMTGAFYNDGTAGAPNTATGDVRARITLQSGSASYTVFRCTNPACSASTFLTAGALTSSAAHPLGVGTVHTLLTRWDPDAHLFTFRLDDAVPTQVDPTGVASVAVPSPRYPFHGFTTSVGIGGIGAGTSGSIEATVNDVRVQR